MLSSRLPQTGLQSDCWLASGNRNKEYDLHGSSHHPQSAFQNVTHWQCAKPCLKAEAYNCGIVAAMLTALSNQSISASPGAEQHIYFSSDYGVDMGNFHALLAPADTWHLAQRLTDMDYLTGTWVQT
jgi:hypothetical protein